MSAIRAAIITFVMLSTMIVVMTGLNARGGDEAMAADGYGISAHVSPH